MGLAESCAIFETISDGLAFIMHKLGIDHIVKVLDDFLLLAISKPDCDCAFEQIQFIGASLNIPLAAKKTSSESTQKITFLGIELDTQKMTARLPQEKLRRYARDVHTLIQGSKTTKKEIQQIIGKLHFATCVIPIGKPFLRRLIDSIRPSTLGPLVHFTISDGMKADLRIWQAFLSQFNGTTILAPSPTIDSTTINLLSDASDLGFGGIYASHWIQGAWNPLWKNLNIAVRELYPILALVGMFGHLWKNHSIHFKCDNQAIVAVINKHTARDPTIMKLI